MLYTITLKIIIKSKLIKSQKKIEFDKKKVT